MVFSSLRFFLFLCAILFALSFPYSRRSKKIVLCVGSCLFYAAWDYRYLLLLLLISAIDFYCAARIAQTEVRTQRRFWLLVSVVTNLGILGYFKYVDFFLDNLNGFLQLTGHPTTPLLHVFLPAGISFYTFKSMSYTIDVHRKVIAPVGSLIEYAMFVTFFPDLIAGPIVRASVFLPQLDREIGPTWMRIRSGASLFLIGLAKKLLIADHCAVVADAVFAAPAMWSCFDAWCGLIAYGLQIYCDFSGYSDMAIGTAKMIGYDLPENFRMPYLASNPADFWHRWHVTLSEWLRDYLYIPLGGNRKGQARTYLNLILTMFLGGLWHGASWNFALWGLLHGTALAVHRVYRSLLPDAAMPRILATPLMTTFALLCWVPFRAVGLNKSLAMFAALFGAGTGNNLWLPTVLAFSLLLVIAGHIFANMPASIASRFDVIRESDAISGPYYVFSVGRIRGAFLVMAIALTIYYFGAVATSPFIYFQF